MLLRLPFLLTVKPSHAPHPPPSEKRETKKKRKGTNVIASLQSHSRAYIYPEKKQTNLKTRVLLVQGVASLLPQSLGHYLEPEFISVSSPTSGSRHHTHETASITITEAGVLS